MSSIFESSSDVPLMEEKRRREERERKLRKTLTVGELRDILNSIPAERDNVPVVVVKGPEFSPLTDWRGERWRGTMVADGNVLALYLEA